MPHVDYGGPTGRRLIGCFLQQGGGHPEELMPCGVWRMGMAEQGGLWPPVFGRAQEPPLSSRWPLLIGTGYNCRRPLRSCTELPVLSQLEHGVRLRRPLLCCCLAVLGPGRGPQWERTWTQAHRLTMDKAGKKKNSKKKKKAAFLKSCARDRQGCWLTRFDAELRLALLIALSLSY
jgi:hypothetical protein